MTKTDFDAIVVGSGPNGLAAAIRLQQSGLSVLLLEGSSTIGGGLRSKELTLPGFVHDVCSAIHPMAAASPFLSTLPLHEHGLEFIYPEVAAAHPFDNGSAAVLKKSMEETATLLGEDKEAYLHLMKSVVRDWPKIVPDVLGPLPIPKYPIAMAGFGLKALTSATFLAQGFHTPEAKGLWAGMAAHSIQPLSNLATSAIGLVLMAVGHLRGWPIPKGGSQQIANAMASYFVSLGGKIETGYYVKSLK
ncbi:MAG: NAD(P)/FAD-dependent oxidoreductase, partial [Bacteroidota bacterium]|nr:NAD(P)/FAD-dependent oxidoreductase [Bacteroidota bacterium]